MNWLDVLRNNGVERTLNEGKERERRMGKEGGKRDRETV